MSLGRSSLVGASLNQQPGRLLTRKVHLDCYLLLVFSFVVTHYA